MAAPWYDALGFLNVIDWLEGLVRGVAYGDIAPHRIALHHPDSDWWEENPQAQRWFLNDVRQLLDSFHVVTYQHGFNDREIWTHVKNEQARWAEYLLIRAGAPVIMDTVDERNQQWANNPQHGGQMPVRWEDRPDRTNVRKKASRNNV